MKATIKDARILPQVLTQIIIERGDIIHVDTYGYYIVAKQGLDGKHVLINLSNGNIMDSTPKSYAELIDLLNGLYSKPEWKLVKATIIIEDI